MNFSKKTVREIIDEYKVFHVPYYQREYVWEGKNNQDSRTTYNKFIIDIANEYFDKPNARYFIGNIAVNKTSISEIVDGQQRITTLVLFLCILADNFCSRTIKAKNKTVVYNASSTFIIQESQYLTRELEGSLNYKLFTGTGERIELDKTISKSIALINRHYSRKSEPEFDGLYNYILNNVEAIILEYNNTKDALRYFLNINSFSIKLTPDEIFLTILSQALKVSRSAQTIYDVKQSIKDIENSFDKIKTNDIISIFINAYYKADKDISDLKTLDVGKWMSYYHNDVYSEYPEAKDFCDNFSQYLIDLKEILNYYQCKTVSPNLSSPIYLTYALLKYERYLDLVELLTVVLKNRHNYRTDNIYEAGTKSLSQDLMEDLSKRINYTLYNNYLRDSNKRLDLLTTNIELETTTKNPKLTLNDILINTKGSINSIFSLTYMTDPQSNPKPQIKDKSRIIQAIFSLQQGFLSFTANKSNSYYAYIDNCLNSGSFTIEHLFSIKEFTDTVRIDNWKKIKGKFNNSTDFDNERSLFENLTLLNGPSNSSANDLEIYNKFTKYKNAHSILGSGDEFLVQSLVDGSNFYSNPNIITLGLPERKITNISHNTWEHSANNRSFNILLLEKSLEALL
ncbi:MAG: DUF262 domain-containing protein [Candidatus Izemoplasmatales bacterium]|nr:DUF262 domain-containing protein [Candidatus Izemoplasmatales bacterium]